MIAETRDAVDRAFWLEGFRDYLSLEAGHSGNTVEAYLRDLPTAELHRLESGHFAVEDCLDTIATTMRRFYEERVAAPPLARRTA